MACYWMYQWLVIRSVMACYGLLLGPTGRRRGVRCILKYVLNSLIPAPHCCYCSKMHPKSRRGGVSSILVNGMILLNTNGIGSVLL